MDETSLRRGVAEFIGTFTLIFIGGGAGIVSGQDIVAVALANGLAIGIMVSNLGHISGGHFNPAITLGFVATRRITLPLAAAYWVSQFAGAVVAALHPALALRARAVVLGAVPHARRLGAGKGARRRDHPDVLPRLGGLRDRGRPARRVQVDRRPRDRPHDHDRRADGRPAHGRRDEPGARVRPASSSATTGASGWIYYARPVVGALDRGAGLRVPVPPPDAAARRRHAGVRRRRAAARRHGTQLDQAPLGGPARELVAARELQLAQHRRHVRLDRPRRQVQPRGDLLVACSRARSAAAPRARAR